MFPYLPISILPIFFKGLFLSFSFWVFMLIALYDIYFIWLHFFIIILNIPAIMKLYNVSKYFVFLGGVRSSDENSFAVIPKYSQYITVWDTMQYEKQKGHLFLFVYLSQKF